MHLERYFAATLILVAMSTSRADTARWESAARWISPELRQVDSDRHAVENALARLPPAPPRNVTERLGYHSGYTSEPDTVDWVDFDLGDTETIDAVVIIAAASNSGGSAAAGYGFPLRFRVELLKEAGAAEVGDGIKLADFANKDFPNPGALPLFLPAQGRKARVVRITANRLFHDEYGYLFALGEVMILQGKHNLVADLSVRGARKIDASRSGGVMPVWGKINLGDGHSAIGPPVGVQASPTFGYQGDPLAEPKSFEIPDTTLFMSKWVQIDLGESMPIKQVCLFPAHPPEFVHRQGYLFPPRFRIDVSDSPGFEVAATIVSFEKSSFPNPGNNAITFTGGNRAGRYVRLTALELSNSLSFFRFALAEMQVWSNSKNVALGKSVTASDSFEKDGWSRAALVDGFASQANIVDRSPWLAALSQRRELSQQLAELERQRGVALNGLVAAGMWGAAGLAIVTFTGLLIFLWKQRWQRRRELDALRLRISQDLHDEVGSNLGTIALISHGLLTTANDPAQTRNSLEEIQTISRQTVDSMRDIARLVQSPAYGHGDLSIHLREIAARMLRNVPHQVHLDAYDIQKYLRVDQQRDLVLIYTEALYNIVRHAHATEVGISLTSAGGVMNLIVQDNGRGFVPDAEKSSGMGLTNIRRRAEKFGGEVHITSQPTRGTTLAITLPAS